MASYLERLQSLVNEEKKNKGRAIVFWLEEEGDWNVESLQHVLGECATVKLLVPNQSLVLKKEIERERAHHSFVLYSPNQLSEKDLEPLLSMLLVGAIFQNDDISTWSERFNIDEWTLRELKEKYPLFFNANTRLNKLEKYLEKHKNTTFDERTLIYVTVNSKPSILEAFFQILKMGTDLSGNKHIKEIKRQGLFKLFLKELSGALAVSYIEDESFLVEGIDTIIASSYFRDGGILNKELEKLKSSKVNQLAEKYRELIISSELKSQWASWTKEFIERYNLKTQLSKLQTQQLLRFNSLTVVDEIILQRIIEEAYETPIEHDINHLKLIVEQRLAIDLVFENKHLFNEYCFWKSYISLRSKLNEVVHNSKIRPVNADSLYEEYMIFGYKVDQLVRNLYTALRHINCEKYHDLYKVIQIRYEREWLEPMANHASDLVKNNKSKSNLPHQTSFYQNWVNGPKIQMKARQYIIISDGFRYEVGKELTIRLRYELNCRVKCEGMLSSLPSYTQLGMASLLPQLGQLSVGDNKQVYVGEFSTSGLTNREQVLKKMDEHSVAYKLSDFMTRLSKERKEMVKGKSIVYLYHDVIDAVGDKMSTEHQTFEMAEIAIEELRRAINLLLNMEAKRITITADHGFLYLSETATKASKVLNERGKLLDGNNRFQMQRKIQDPTVAEYGAFSLNDVDQSLSETETLIAEGLNRFRTGQGTRYFHGGVTPQERVVPVAVVEAIQGLKRVEASVLDNNFVISDYNPKITLYQTELVSDSIFPTPIRVSFWKDDQRVSNERVVLCEASTKKEQEQVIELHLFELEYLLHENITLLLEIPKQNGQWERYKTYLYKIRIIGGKRNE